MRSSAWWLRSRAGRFWNLCTRSSRGVYVHLWSGLGFTSEPWWWPLPPLAVAGVAIAIAVVKLPGHGGHEPSEAVVSVLRLPLSSIVLALLLTGGSAGVAPLIIVGVAVAYLVTLALAVRTRQHHQDVAESRSHTPADA